MHHIEANKGSRWLIKWLKAYTPDLVGKREGEEMDFMGFFIYEMNKEVFSGKTNEVLGAEMEENVQ